MKSFVVPWAVGRVNRLMIYITISAQCGSLDTTAASSQSSLHFPIPPPVGNSPAFYCQLPAVDIIIIISARTLSASSCGLCGKYAKLTACKFIFMCSSLPPGPLPFSPSVSVSFFALPLQFPITIKMESAIGLAKQTCRDLFANCIDSSYTL